MDSKNEESVYLLEEGLELWLATLHNSKTLLPQWMELTRFMPPILGNLIFHFIDEYYNLDGDQSYNRL